MHEDIEFLRNNWGKVVIAQFGRKNIGMLGVAGSTYKSYTSSMWVTDGTHGDSVGINLLQYFKCTDKPPARYRVILGGESAIKSS